MVGTSSPLYRSSRYGLSSTITTSSSRAKATISFRSSSVIVSPEGLLKSGMT